MTGCEQQTSSYRWQYDCDNMQTDEQLSVTVSRHFSCTLRTHANRGTNGRLVTSSNLSLVTVAFHDAIAKLSSLGWLSTGGRQGLKRKATGGMGDQQHRPRPWGGEVKECEDWLAPLVADLERAMWAGHNGGELCRQSTAVHGLGSSSFNQVRSRTVSTVVVLRVVSWAHQHRGCSS